MKVNGMHNKAAGYLIVIPTPMITQFSASHLNPPFPRYSINAYVKRTIKNVKGTSGVEYAECCTKIEENATSKAHEICAAFLLTDKCSVTLPVTIAAKGISAIPKSDV